jgi:hypothetical protein
MHRLRQECIVNFWMHHHRLRGAFSLCPIAGRSKTDAGSARRSSRWAGSSEVGSRGRGQYAVIDLVGRGSGDRAHEGHERSTSLCRQLGLHPASTRAAQPESRTFETPEQPDRRLDLTAPCGLPRLVPLDAELIDEFGAALVSTGPRSDGPRGRAASRRVSELVDEAERSRLFNLAAAAPPIPRLR